MPDFFIANEKNVANCLPSELQLIDPILFNKEVQRFNKNIEGYIKNGR